MGDLAGRLQVPLVHKAVEKNVEPFDQLHMEPTINDVQAQFLITVFCV
jgi:hypothetical protein